MNREEFVNQVRNTNNPFLMYLRRIRLNHSFHHLWVNTGLLKADIKHKPNIRPARKVAKLVLFYRICDAGRQVAKPSYITKENCLANAVEEFPLNKVEWHVLADNIFDETYEMIQRYIPKEHIERVSIGNGAKTFQKIYEEAMQLDDNSFVYFLEDDYVHAPGAMNYLIEAAEKNYTDYYTLYDHPDKYEMEENLINPFSIGGGEYTRVFWSGSRHWKETNSTTMTLAAFADIIKRDQKTFWRWTSGKFPFDYSIFNDLRMCKGAILSCPIPSLSTHGDNHFAALGSEWGSYIKPEIFKK